MTAGGRVLGVTALGDSVATAREGAYAAAAMISWNGTQLRRDIAARAASSEGLQPQAPVTDPDVEAQLEEFEVDAPLVGIVMGSKSDIERMQGAADELDRARDLATRSA